MEQDERKLFVGKLPPDVTEDEIRLIFNTYGRTTDVHLMDASKQQPGQGRVAFVSYDSRTCAQTAMQVLNGVYRFREDARDPINVSVAKPRNGGGRGKASSRSRERERSRSRDGPGGAGGYYDMMAQRGGCGGVDPRLAAYGAYGAYPFGFGGPPAGGGGYPGFDPRGGPNMDKDRKGGGKGPHGPPGSKIYVSNLPRDISRQALEMVFGVYGQVLDSYIMSGRSKTTGQSCAFVWYSNEREARTAIAAMDAGYEIRPGEGNIIVKEAHDKPGAGGRDRSPDHF